MYIDLDNGLYNLRNKDNVNINKAIKDLALFLGLTLECTDEKHIIYNSELEEFFKLFKITLWQDEQEQYILTINTIDYFVKNNLKDNKLIFDFNHMVKI